MYVNDEEILCKLLQDTKSKDISDSECSGDSDMNVKILSTSEYSVSPDDEDRVSDIQNGTQTKFSTE
jgi:hypothetical protein